MAAQKAFPPLAPDPTADGEWLSPDEQRLWRSMVSVHARLVAQLDAQLQAAHDLSLRDYEVLVHLSEAPNGSLRMAELADRLFVSPSGLTRRLDGLVRDGLVRRQACLSDRRGTLAVLSHDGRQIVEEASPTHAAAVRRYVFEVLDRWELRHLTASLSAMSDALDGMGPTHSGPATQPGDWGPD